jgi:signal transduction histidine kinase
MMPQSLQARATLAAAIGILVAVAIVGVAVDVLATRHVHRTLDHSLRQRAVEVAQLSASAPALLTSPGTLDSTLGATQITVEVLDRRDRLVARSLSLGGRVLPASSLVRSAIRSGRAAYGTASQAGDTLRLYAAPLADFGGPAAGGAVVVAASQHEAEQTIASLHLFVTLGGLIAAALGAAAVAFLIRRALRPLTRLADAAAEVERTGDPHRRLPLPTAGDEVGRLAATLNAMLASLERARDAERRFLADASHELRTPLTALRGNVAYLSRHGATPEVLADLERDADRLARLADDLLALSREEASVTPTDDVRLDAVVRNAVGDDASVDLAAEPIRVRGDAAALERAVTNLVRNAHAYGPSEGRIAVSVTGRNGRALITVTDEGAGLRLEETKLAFQRFWRGGSNGEGSGLGLAIVQATAGRHGGRAYAEGSTFTIELPALKLLSENLRTTGGEELEQGPS